MATVETITIRVQIKPGLSLWDAIKLRIAGKGQEVFWNAIAQKILADDDNKGDAT